MASNFEFLDQDFPVLSAFGRQAEAYCYSDPNSCLIKLGMMGETIVNLMFTFDRLPFPQENTSITRIDNLYREGLLTSDLKDILHILRKKRNKSVHENYQSESDAKTLLPMAHSLCQWFMQTYGDWNYQQTLFIMPSDTTAISAISTIQEDDNEEVLIRQAESAAVAAPVISPSERKKQASKAAGLRQKSEAETRYMIDEQLRKVGWEADSENLCYSKGVRPQKGGFHNEVRRRFLQAVYQQNRQAVYFHKGDIDVYGFLILHNLKEKTGIPFHSLDMDVETLRKYYQMGYYKELDDNDRKMMKSKKLDGYREVLMFMEEHNCKMEQESVKAAEIKIQLREEMDERKDIANSQ